MLVKGSFEDYLYILIGVVWVAVSIYKGAQKRKKAASAPSSSEPEQKKSFIDAFLEEFEEKQTPIYEEPKPDDFEELSTRPIQAEAENIDENYVFSYDDQYEESNVNEYDDVYKKEPETIIRTQELSKPVKRRKKRRLDLRRAVIYSELLRRPYL